MKETPLSDMPEVTPPLVTVERRLEFSPQNPPVLPLNRHTRGTCCFKGKAASKPTATIPSPKFKEDGSHLNLRTAIA